MSSRLAKKPQIQNSISHMNAPAAFDNDMQSTGLLELYGPIWVRVAQFRISSYLLDCLRLSVPSRFVFETVDF